MKPRPHLLLPLLLLLTLLPLTSPQHTIQSATQECLNYVMKNSYKENDLDCGGVNPPHWFTKHVCRNYGSCRSGNTFPYSVWLHSKTAKESWMKAWDLFKGKPYLGPVNHQFAIRTYGRKCTRSKKEFDKTHIFKNINVQVRQCTVRKTGKNMLCVYTAYPYD